MAGGARPGGDPPGGILDLLRLASDRPREAQAKAHVILAAGPAPYEASVAHQAIGMLHREFGELDAPTAELSTAVRLQRAARSSEREADVLATLGVPLTYRGHSSMGLGEAEHRYRQLAVPLLELATDRCAVLLAAGLPADALAEADAALGGSGRGGGRAARRAELLLAGARAALAAGEPGLAATRARAAQRLFTAQGRSWWRTHAGLLLLQARCASHPPSARLLHQGGQLAADLDLLGSGEAAQARLLAGQLAGVLGRQAEADAHLRAAARNRYRRVTALARAQGWLAEALRAGAAGDRRRL